MEDGSSETVKPNEIKVIKKASEARPGNDLELQTQNDGATVGIREANDIIKVGKDAFVPGRVSDKYADSKIASKPCLVKSVDYTSKGENDKIEIMIGETKIMIEKKFVEDVKLNETGVYNSETDKENNPKTGENKPDELTGMVSKLIDSVAGVIGSLEDIKDMVEENSSLSYTALETCIAELQSYVKSLEDESDVSAQASAN